MKVMTLIPPVFLDCVVAIGVIDNDKRKWVASGFLYGHHISDTADGKSNYRVYLVSNRHVFENFKSILIRANPRGNQPAREYTAELEDKNGTKIWTPHPDPKIDVAVIPINIKLLQEQQMQVDFFTSNGHAANLNRINDLGITEGDFVYTLGFPMGLIGEQRNTVIVRTGVIARIQDAISRTNNEFLIDSSIFPGNSGGLLSQNLSLWQLKELNHRMPHIL